MEPIAFSFATWLRDAGVSLDDIRPLMGHESRNMTDRYASINMSRVSGLLDLMPKLRELKSPGKTEAFLYTFVTVTAQLIS